MTCRKIMLFALIGIFLWFVAAIWLREWAPAFYDLGAGHLIAFALATFTAPLFVWGMAKATATPLDAMVAPTGIAIVAATLLDGIALTWFPAFYAGQGPHLAHTGAQLLWGVGCAMLSALIFARRRLA